MARSKEYQKGFEDGYTSVTSGDDERDYALKGKVDYRQGYMDGEAYGQQKEKQNNG
jgi:hypothetical protein